MPTMLLKKKIPKLNLVNLINSDQLNYNELSEQNLIILNELKVIPQGLSTILNEHIENGGMLAIIPSAEINQSSYQQLFSSLNLSSLQQKQEEELKITNINFRIRCTKMCSTNKLKISTTQKSLLITRLQTPAIKF